MDNKNIIIVETIVNKPIEIVWKKWNNPEDMIKWSFASDDWHSPKALNDLRVGGNVSTRMESKDGKIGFDFNGTYTVVEENKVIEYIINDSNRKVRSDFIPVKDGIKISIEFEAETENSIEQQRAGWQAILDNFKKYTESL